MVKFSKLLCRSLWICSKTSIYNTRKFIICFWNFRQIKKKKTFNFVNVISPRKEKKALSNIYEGLSYTNIYIRKLLKLFFCTLCICMQTWNVYIHHHHHVVPPARISLTLSRHSSLSFIASGRSSGLHPVSSHSCCMYVRAGHPAFALPYVGVHRSTSLMSSSLLLQQCPACWFHLTWIVFVMGGWWPYIWCICRVLPPGLV